MISCGHNHMKHGLLAEWTTADVQVIARREPPLHDLPLAADQVRVHHALANPFRVDELRDLGGLDEPVQDFLQAQPEWASLLDDTLAAVSRHFESGRAVVTAAVMCSGGHDRSVAAAELLARNLKAWPETDAFTRHLHLYRRHPWVPALARRGA